MLLGFLRHWLLPGTNENQILSETISNNNNNNNNDDNNNNNNNNNDEMIRLV